MDVTIIIVNYNSPNETQKAIQSILKQKNVAYEIIVVDNASSDHSTQSLSQYSPHITLICNQENIGFGAANNQAAKIAKGQYLCLLNPDTEFEHDSALYELVNYISRHPEYGIVGAKILSYENEETPKKMQYPGEHYVKGRFSHLPGETAWVLGAIMFFKREVFEAVQGFDKDYFVYGEDADICLRIRKEGHAIGHCEKVIVRHLGSVTARSENYYKTKLRKENGLYIFYRKHYELNQVKKLIQKRYYKALWRRFVLKLKKTLTELNPDEKIKYLRYQAMIDLGNLYLKKGLLTQPEYFCVFRTSHRFQEPKQVY